MSHGYHMICLTTPLLQKAVQSPYRPEQRNVPLYKPVLLECANRSWPPRGEVDRHLCGQTHHSYGYYSVCMWIPTANYGKLNASYRYDVLIWLFSMCMEVQKIIYLKPLGNPSQCLLKYSQPIHIQQLFIRLHFPFSLSLWIQELNL